ncbi:hypothetical protein SCHPADRAFT_946602 [Schizopora paradoxa]|uniref:Uncharacterized protein n=1 Tax=Schizopora paradoxa TaxID=27342 RepID=A0A0H2RLT5_9AGAM|nr:hypothetical protein SCHPADRAFT_946602 [Schizopora paradoxa]
MAPEALGDVTSGELGDARLRYASDLESFKKSLRENGVLDRRPDPAYAKTAEEMFEKGYHRVFRTMDCLTRRFEDEKIVISASHDSSWFSYAQSFRLGAADASEIIATMELFTQALEAAERDVEDEEAEESVKEVAARGESGSEEGEMIEKA